GNQPDGSLPTLGNYPDTAIPLSANTTVTPDAVPANTITINVSTSTNFKGKLEGNPGTGTVRVTDAHPAGAYTVTVTAFDGTGTQPRAIAVGDFNGDGNEDLATANNSGTVSILLGDGAGNFGIPTNFGAGGNPISVAVGDFNGDGKLDLAVANSSTANVSILL